MLRRFTGFLLLTITAACGGGSPAAPATPAPLASGPAGFWSGELRWTGCSGLRHCFALLNQTDPFVLNLRPSSGGVEGLLATREYVMELRGAEVEPGSWVLEGFTPAASEMDSTGSVDVTRFEIRMRPSGFAGAITFSVRAGAAIPMVYQAVDYSASVESARRGADPSLTATRWRGRSVVRQCSTSGWTFCYPVGDQEVRPIELTLNGTTGTVGGELDLSISGGRLPVTGAFGGGGLRLDEAASSHVVSGGSVEIRLLSFSARPDDFGRLRGTLSWRHTWHRDAGPPYHTEYQAELWQVVSFRP
jgi:hypothetical protein